MKDVKLYQGDVIEKLAKLPAGKVHCCITSPPYFSLRSYLSADHPLKAKEIGSEPTVGEFIETMVRVFREVRRVMHPSGLLFLNLSDTYASGPRGNKPGDLSTSSLTNPKRQDTVPRGGGYVGDGQLLNIPHRVAEALRADGWVWRQTIVWCLSGGTWLYARTAKGDSPAMLKDLVRLDPSTVQLWNGKKWTRVVSWIRNRQESRDYPEIEFRNGERIGCTAEHRWPTQRGLLSASELVVGDVVPNVELPTPLNRLFCWNESLLGWLVGFYLAEGNLTDKGVVFSIHQDEVDCYHGIRHFVEQLDGTVSLQQNAGKGATIVVYSRVFRELVKQYISGQISKNKRLTRKAWMRSNTFLRGILAGYLEGDGSWDKVANRWRLGFTDNDGLAIDLRTLCARLGKICVLRRTQHQCNGKEFPGWRGEIREQSEHWNAKPIGEIVAIRRSRAREFWDIEVEDEPHTFALASGILTHNSKRSPMPESCKGWRWERCKVKLKGTSAPHSGGIRGTNLETGWTKHTHPETRQPARYAPCPGCKKCEPHGGYVLRKGRGRCTTAHEFVFVMAATDSYFWDSAAFTERAGFSGFMSNRGLTGTTGSGGNRNDAGRYREENSTGMKNPRSVWILSSEPSKIAHFATFPSELVRRCIRAGTSDGGCCSICKAPYAPVVETEQLKRERPADRTGYHEGCDGNTCGNTVAGVRTRILEYRPTCGCGKAESVPCTVLDPFLGSGTTAAVAVRRGRRAIGIELNPEYMAMAKKRIKKAIAKRGFAL